MAVEPPEGPDVDRFRKAARGLQRQFRASTDFLRAARWLEARGYPDAATALATAARGELKGFWNERRLQAFTIALRTDNAPDWSSNENVATGSVISNAASFMRGAALLLMIGDIAPISSANAARIRRCIALLAVAILDTTDPNWRIKRW
jgi:hypothetical protein